MSRDPAQHTIPYSFLRTVFTLSTTGYAIGQGVAFAEAGISIDAFIGGSLLRYSAIGAMTGASAAVAFGIVYGGYTLLQRYRHRDHQQLDDEDDVDTINPKIQRYRHFLRPSASEFFSLDVRIFIAAHGFSFLAAAIGATQYPFVGDLAGRGMGAIVGAATALLYQPKFALAIAKCFSKPAESIKSRHWSQESRHDVPFYIRAFCAAVVGYVSVTSLGDPTDENFAATRQTWTILSTVASILSPALFAGVRRGLLKMEDNSPLFNRVHLLRESTMDIPWYARLVAGIVATFSLSLAVNAYTGKAMAMPGLWTSAAMTPLFTPMLSGLIMACVRRTAAEDTAALVGGDQRDAPAPVDLTMDTPWYLRAAFASVGGMMFGAACDYMSHTSSDPSEPVVMTRQLGFAAIAMGFALLTPWMQSVVEMSRHVRSFFDLQGSLRKTNPKADLSTPWYTRLLMGAWTGAVLGLSFGEEMPGLDKELEFKDPEDVVPGYIGPGFLGESNGVGAPISTVIFATLFVVQPLLSVLASKAGAEIAKRSQLNFFKICCVPQSGGDSAQELGTGMGAGVGGGNA